MTVTKNIEAAIRDVIRQKYAPLRKPYEEARDKKQEAANRIRERASKAYDAIMLEAYETLEHIPSYGSYDSRYRSTPRGLKPKFDTTEEWDALKKLDAQADETANAIIMRLTLMGKVDIMGVIEEYFKENNIA